MSHEFNKLLEQCESDTLYEEEGSHLLLDILGNLYSPIELMGSPTRWQLKLQECTTGNCIVLPADDQWLAEYNMKMFEFLERK